MVEISHACVFNTETEEFEVIKIDDFATFKPKTYKDFHQYESYTVKCGQRKFDDVEILALGDNQSMKNFLEKNKSAIITHATVQSQDENEYSSVKIDEIFQFKNFIPKYKTRFDPNRTYSLMENLNGTTSFRQIQIHALGDQRETKEMIELLVSRPTHALVRTVVKDAFQIVELYIFVQKNGWLFRHNRDFDEFREYQIIDDRKKTVSVQVLKLGQLQDCQSEMTIFMSISHLLVRLVKTDRKKIIPLNKVPQIAEISPETGKEFYPDRLYTYESESGPKAIQIYLMAHENIIIFECLTSPRRFKKKRFTNSDVECIESSVLNNAASNPPKKRKHDEMPTSNRASLSKKQAALKKSKSVVPENEKETDDLSGNHSEDSRSLEDLEYENEDEDDDTKALHKRIRKDQTNAMDQNNNERSKTPVRSPGATYGTARKDIFAGMETSGDTRRNHGIPLASNRVHQSRSRKRTYASKHGHRVTQESSMRRIRHNRHDVEEFYDQYWSDASIGETNDLEVFQEWSDYESNDPQSHSIEMVHLGWGHSIPRKAWSNIKKSKRPSLFVKNLSRSLWAEKIVDKCLEVKTYYMKSVTGATRTEVTPSKMKSIYQCLKYWVRIYHEDWLHSQTLESITDEIEKWIGEEIAYQMKQYTASHRAQTQLNATKRTSWRKNVH